MQLDLNKDISIEKSKGPFDLITNFGTSEHVSDQYMCFKNIHRLTRLNGLMYHIVPRIGNWTGHCPYYYDVDFFESLAKANGLGMTFHTALSTALRQATEELT